MKTLSRVWVATAALTLALPGSAADSVAWGPAVNGLRMGVSFGVASSRPELHTFLQNVGETTREVLIGREWGRGTGLDLRFIATAPDGKEREGFEIYSFTPIAGLVLPAVVRLESGATHEWIIPLHQIICTEGPGNVTFEALVKQRSSLHVFLETDDKSASWARLASPWIGKVVSGELSPPD
jgi:hypothetical protein